MKQIKTDAVFLDFIGRELGAMGAFYNIRISLPLDGLITFDFIQGIYHEYENIQQPKLVFVDDEGKQSKRQFNDFWNIGD